MKDYLNIKSLTGISTMILFLFLLVSIAMLGSYLKFTMLAVAANSSGDSIVTIAAVGDSITGTGIVATNGWVNQYQADFNSRFQTSSTIVNLATNGITSQQLLDRIESDSTWRQQISSAQIVTLEIGYNDFFQNRGAYQQGICGGTDSQDCLRAMVTNFNNNWDTIVGQIKLLTGNNSQKIAIRAFDIYYSVAAVDQLPSAPYNSSFTVLNNYLSQMNTHIAQSASQNGILLAQVHDAYNGISGAEDPLSKGYILPDAIHPSDAGHTVIANLIKQLGYYPVSFPPRILDPDVTNDGVVRSADILAVDSAYGKKCGNAGYQFDYDLNGDCSISVIDIMVVMNAYGLNWPPNNLSIGKALRFYVKGMSPTNQLVTYAMNGLPNNASLNATTGIFSWTPTASQAGNYTVTFTALYNASQSGQVSLPITVLP